MRKNIPVFFVIIFLMSCFILPVQGTLSWTVQTVDENACSSGYGTSCPIVIDSKNIAHIAYTAVGDPWCVIYASWDGSGWNKQIIAQNSLLQCLVLDVNDNPHILYLNKLSGHLEYTSWDGVSWSVQDTNITDGTYFVLALDNSGYPKIAYIAGSIKYADFNGKTWNIQTVDASTQEPGGLSLVLDSNNKPYVLYSPASYPDNNLTVGIRAIITKIATYNNQSWNIQTLPLPAPTGSIGNIVMDSKGNLHFVCTQHHYVSETDKTTLNTILYSSWIGDSWKVQVVASDIELLSIGQLALDKNDNPHFTYLTPDANGETKSYYASWISETWNIQSISTSAGETASGSLALDEAGNPHISSRRTSGMPYTAPLLYATAKGTIDTPPPTVLPTITSSVVNQDTAFLLVLAVVIAIAIPFIAFFFLKNKK